MSQNNGDDEIRKTGATEEEDEQALQIPTDLYEEILLLLSTKDLLICKCVSKIWLELISSPRFVQKHLYRSKTEEGIRILIPLQSDIIEYYHFNSANTDNISNKIPYPLGISGKDARILGSCDGLICLVDSESCKLALFNPSTRKSVIRAVDGIDFKSFYLCWFGYHPSCGEYVLILCYADRRDFKVVVYKFSNPVLHCSVRQNQGRVICLETIAVLLHGNLDWPAISNNGDKISWVILRYDLHKDKIVEIPMPIECFFKIGVIDGCLFAMLHFQAENCELWIMKEYGVEQSWTKYTNIEGYHKKILSPRGFCSNDDLIIDVDGSSLTKYSFRDREVSLSHLMDYDAPGYSVPIVCDDSLVSPELIWGNGIHD